MGVPKHPFGIDYANRPDPPLQIQTPPAPPAAAIPPVLTSGSYVSSGLWQNYLFVAPVTATAYNLFVCYLPKNTWFRFANIRAVGFAESHGRPEECYFSDPSGQYVGSLSSCWSPDDTNTADGDAALTPVAPVIQTRLFQPSLSLNHYGFGWCDYDMRDPGALNPTLALLAAPGYENQQGTFVAVVESPLQETTPVSPETVIHETSQRFTVGKVSKALALRVVQTGASGKTEIYGIRLQARPLPSNELAGQT